MRRFLFASGSLLSASFERSACSTPLTWAVLKLHGLYALKRMAEGSEIRLDRQSSALDVVEENTETDVQDDPSPYESDTEEVDLDSFVKSLPHDVNDWNIYDADCFTLQKIGNGFFGDIYKVSIRTIYNSNLYLTVPATSWL